MHIYIVLTYTGSILSKLIKYWLKHDYTHSSIALDENLEEMYSFGRIYPRNPIFAGFVKENALVGTFKRFKNTTAMVLKVEITPEEYEKVQYELEGFKNSDIFLRYDMLGLILGIFNKKYNRQNAYYCSEFVKEILEVAELDLSGLPKIVRPQDYAELGFVNKVYEGKLAEYLCGMENKNIEQYSIY